MIREVNIYDLGGQQIVTKDWLQVENLEIDQFGQINRMTLAPGRNFEFKSTTNVITVIQGSGILTDTQQELSVNLTPGSVYTVSNQTSLCITNNNFMNLILMFVSYHG